MSLALLALGSYLVGSLPFGYLIGRARGVNLFEAGSGNIGATNAARVLGRGWGVIVFILDLLKGALPVYFAKQCFDGEWPPVAAAAAAFLGHLYPVFLGFRGGKGVATGAGTVLVLVPVPALASVLAWILTALLTRYVSLASVVSVLVLAVSRLAMSKFNFDPATIYCMTGAALVTIKHRANIQRLLQGTENRIGDGPMRQTLLKALHLLAVGLWFGGAGFFNFAVAPSLNETYKQVVESAPSERTAYQPLGFPQPTADSKAQLASALFGAGVGPVFPIYFAMMAACAAIALATAWAFWRQNPGVRIHRLRLLIAVIAALTVLTGWSISLHVAELRSLRFHADSQIAAAAKAAFASWHLGSLLLSLVTVVLAGILLAMAAKLPVSR